MSDTGAPLYLPTMALDGERVPSAKFNEAMHLLNNHIGGLKGDLVSYWTLNEASGTRADSYGSNNLTDNATVTGAAGKLSTSSQFTAANSEYLSVADNSDLSMGDVDFTITGWAYLDSLGTARGALGKWGTSREYLVSVSTGNQMQFFVTSDGTSGTAVSVTGTTVTLTTATWYFVKAWHDSVGNTINIQVNDGTIHTTAHTLGVFNGTSELRLGSNEVAPNHWNGRLDDWAIWRKALSGAQGTTLYNGGVGLAYPF